MTKLRIQAQHLQPGDIVSSGEVVKCVLHKSIRWPTSKICIILIKDEIEKRMAIWNKHTIINVERKDTDLPILLIDGSPVVNSWNEGACYPKRRGT